MERVVELGAGAGSVPLPKRDFGIPGDRIGESMKKGALASVLSQMGGTSAEREPVLTPPSGAATTASPPYKTRQE